ncbi:hypothetical protein CPB84DRAFT_1871598 [Gymnopilus junonius]|uniref:NAD(P)-binding protein n=1 Tax=Gymnopilus junonius TaxID=109634 RepID=A0A9P5NDH5_GYMJU|nr:hypothetical protein CPB84DRAFT_1871598 [Gymnopilus junonius]
MASSSFPSPSTSGATLLEPEVIGMHPHLLFDVEGLVVVITGGGTGIGLMMAKALENNGATVYIVGRRKETLDKAAAENNSFNKLIPVEGDVTDRDSLLNIVDAVRSRHGYIDVLINNAGIARNLFPHPLPSPEDEPDIAHPPSPPASPTRGPSAPSIKAFQSALWDSGSPEDFAESFLTNVTAVYYTTIIIPAPDRGLSRPPYHTSQVLSVSSSGSFRLDAKVLSPSYTLSKSACTHLGKLMANLLAPWGIRSNVLAPGVWPSEMTTSPTPNGKLDPRSMAEGVPLRRAGTQEAGAYVNGAVWLVDGGRIGTVASNY